MTTQVSIYAQSGGKCGQIQYFLIVNTPRS